MSEEEVIDLYAMKVTELKAELKSRSLPVSGPKAELIERLEKYMQEHEGVTVVDEADLKDKKAPSDDKDDSKTAETGNQNSIEIEESEILNAPTSNDVKPNVTGQEISSMTEKDRIAARADRFKNETPGDSLKKKSRAERFGIPVKEGNVSKEDSDNALKRRAERFGTVSWFWWVMN